MIKFFRKIRQKLLSENKFSKYLLYAIGEIILVVIGILIALQINNLNEQKKRDKEILAINERLILDIDNDIRELYVQQSYWDNLIPVFNKVKSDSITLKLFDEGYTRLITTRVSTSLNKTGVQQLKALNLNDDLSLRIVKLYEEMENSTIIPTEKDINNRANKMLDYYKDNYSWFSEWISQTITSDNSSKELQDFFLSSLRYKNEVALNHLTINIYLSFIEHYIVQLEEIRTILKQKTDSDFISISSDNLKQYVGSYETYKIEGDSLGFKSENRFQIDSFENFLRISDSGGYSDGLYLKSNNTFFTESDGVKVNLKFDKNPSSEISDAILIIKTSDKKGVFNLKLVNKN
ncbi:hypothetical protein KH5_12210 [Urechidicola sp. KH5]